MVWNKAAEWRFQEPKLFSMFGGKIQEKFWSSHSVNSNCLYNKLFDNKYWCTNGPSWRYSEKKKVGNWTTALPGWYFYGGALFPLKSLVFHFQDVWQRFLVVFKTTVQQIWVPIKTKHNTAAPKHKNPPECQALSCDKMCETCESLSYGEWHTNKNLQEAVIALP